MRHFKIDSTIVEIYNFIGTTLTKFVLQADLVAVTISKYVDVLKSKYKKNNIALIPHGAFETPPEPSYELPKGPKKVMTFGKFGTYKKVESMIEAVHQVRANTGLELEVVIAGTDNPNVPGYLATVKEAYKHIPQVRFTGYVEEHEVPSLFQALRCILIDVLELCTK